MSPKPCGGSKMPSRRSTQASGFTRRRCAVANPRSTVAGQLADECRGSLDGGHVCADVALMLRRCLCENFLYGFKAAPRGRSRRQLGRLSQAPAPLPPGWPLTPAGWRESRTRGRRDPGKSRSRGGLDTGTPRGGSIGLRRRPEKAARSRASVQPPPPCQIHRSAEPDPGLGSPSRGGRTTRRRQGHIDGGGWFSLL
jgi:hypothetical protein